MCELRDVAIKLEVVFSGAMGQREIGQQPASLPRPYGEKNVASNAQPPVLLSRDPDVFLRTTDPRARAKDHANPRVPRSCEAGRASGW